MYTEALACPGAPPSSPLIHRKRVSLNASYRRWWLWSSCLKDDHRSCCWCSPRGRVTPCSVYGTGLVVLYSRLTGQISLVSFPRYSGGFPSPVLPIFAPDFHISVALHCMNDGARRRFMTTMACTMNDGTRRRSMTTMACTMRGVSGPAVW